ncbi:hypothetical protein D3C80_1359900 [compost metagenome]
MQFHGWRNQAIDNGFGYYVRDSDPKQDLLLVGLGSQQGFQFATQLKHLLGVGQGLATGLGQFQLSSDSPEQFDPVGLLQQADLPADGLGRQVQLLAGTHNAAGFGHDPEVMQLPIIEHGHSPIRKNRSIAAKNTNFPEVFPSLECLAIDGPLLRPSLF